MPTAAELDFVPDKTSDSQGFDPERDFQPDHPTAADEYRQQVGLEGLPVPASSEELGARNFELQKRAGMIQTPRAMGTLEAMATPINQVMAGAGKVATEVLNAPVRLANLVSGAKPGEKAYSKPLDSLQNIVNLPQIAKANLPGMPGVIGGEPSTAAKAVQLGAGAYNKTAALASGLSAPGTFLPAVVLPGGIAKAAFGTQIAANIPGTIQESAKVLRDPNATLMEKGGALAAPPAEAWMLRQIVKSAPILPQAAKAAAEASGIKLKGEPNAIQRESPTILQPLREQPVEGAGQVPTEAPSPQAGERGQPTPEVQAQAPVKQPVRLTPEEQAAAQAELAGTFESRAKPIANQIAEHVATEAKPSFASFEKDKPSTMTPGELRDQWATAVWDHLMKSPGSRLNSLAKSLRLRRQIQEGIPDAQQVPEGTPPDSPIVRAQQRRNEAIATIGDSLINQSAPDASVLERKSVTPQEVGFKRRSVEPAFRPFTADEALNRDAFGKLATEDSRESGMPVSAAKRLIVMRNRTTGEIEMVSAFRDGRKDPKTGLPRGPVAVNPAASGKARPNVPIASLLADYEPLYSVLLDDPVQNLHQHFASLSDFETQFGQEAKRLAQEHQASLEGLGEALPPIGAPGVRQAVAGELQRKPGTLTSTEPLTEPEALELAKHFLGEEGEAASVEEVQNRIEELSAASQSGRVTPQQQVAISALRKIANEFERQHPELNEDQGYEQLTRELHEAVSDKGITDAAKALLSRRGGAEGDVRAVSQPEQVEPEYEEIGHDGETAFESKSPDLSGLPAGVPNRGPQFPSELMEASRQLGALVRSKVNLGPGVLGRFVRTLSGIAQDDRIEVGDIRNQATVSHEIGHDLDSILFPVQNMGNSQASLAARVPGTGTGKELHKELVTISELMRGPITGSKGHIAYRKRATELLADYFSLYAHDPTRARVMAPRFSKGYEDALARNPDAAGVVHQLVEMGAVEPVPAERLPATGASTPTPGKVPARPQAVAVPRDLPLAVAGEELVTGVVRDYSAETEAARIKADKWRKRVPDKSERQDVGAFVEGIQNVEVPGDTISAVRSRMTPDMDWLVKQYRFEIEFQRQQVNRYMKGLTEGEYVKFLEDYLPHFYSNGAREIQGTIGRFKKDSPNAKRRKLPTLQEAVDLGLKPITQDPATLYEITANINWRVATNRKVLGVIKDMKTASGDPAVVPVSQSPPGWEITNNPLVQRVYARPTAAGLELWKGGAAIHPDLWRAVRQILETPTSGRLGRAYDAVNAFTRSNAFALSLFHDVTLRAASLGAQMRWYNPARGLFRLFERNPVTGELEIIRSPRGIGKELMQDEDTVMDAARHGLKFSWTDSQAYERSARVMLEKIAAQMRDVPVLGKSLKMARDIQHWRHEGLWKNTHDALKIIAYDDLVTKALQDAPPGVDAKAIKEEISSRLNDTFGGQEWQTKFWLSPTSRKIISRFMLAPDWTLSTLRSVPFLSSAASTVRGNLPRVAGREPIPTTPTTFAGNLGRAKFWSGELAALAIGTIAIQYAIYQMFGDKRKGDKQWIWENEAGQNRRIDATPLMRKLPWRDPKDPTRYYVNMGKRPEEILTWVIDPIQNMRSKMSRPVAEVFKQVTGQEGGFKADWAREHQSFVEGIPGRIKSASQTMVPFVFGGNQFALSVPYRKGMTKFKAQEAYESAFGLIAEPNRFRQALRGVPPTQDAIQNLLRDISDAAERNGVPAIEIYKRARSAVRSRYYGDYFKAFSKGDMDAANKAAVALIRLGATTENIRESVKRRHELEAK